MAMCLHKQDSIAPATDSLDFNLIASYPGPFVVGLIAWVDTDDPLAGALSFQMTHRDPTGADIVSPNIQGALSLSTGGARFATLMEPIVRQSGSSLWTFDTTLIGIAGSALVSYRLIHFPTGAATEWP